MPGAPPPYQQYYQGYPSYPPYPLPQQKASGGGLPFYVWIGVGALVMWAYSKVSGLVRGGPQAAQAKMMSWVSFCLNYIQSSVYLQSMGLDQNACTVISFTTY